MKRNVRIGLVIVAALVIVMLAASNAYASSDYETDCSVCHNDPTGMTITTVSSINVEPGASFQVDVVATGTSQGGLKLRIPSQVDNNNQFTIAVPADAQYPGLVVDNDGVYDLDSTANAIHTIYNFTAPAFTGTYILTIWAAETRPAGIDTSITVNVAGGEGPAIGAPSTTPQVPRANEGFNVNVTVTSTSTINYVRLQYSTDNGTSWENVTMSGTGNVYTGSIPGFPKNQKVLWRIVAADSTGERVSGIQSYVVGQIQVEPITIPQFHYGWLFGAPAIVIAYFGIALEYYDEERFTKIHGIMLGVAYILTGINVISLVMEPAGIWTAMNPIYLFNLANIVMFMHSLHIWLGIISMIFGTLALITHLGGWKTCNFGLLAVVLWTILGIMGVYLGGIFVP